MSSQTNRYLKQNKKYFIQNTESPNWFRVYHDEILLALAMDIATARQVIYKDINSNGGSCNYLVEDDFMEKENQCGE